MNRQLALINGQQRRGRSFIYKAGMGFHNIPHHCITHVTVAEGVEIIEGYAFDNEFDLFSPARGGENDPLKEVKLAASVKVIGAHAFYDCHNVTILQIPKDSQLEEIQVAAFRGTHIGGEIQLPASLRLLWDKGFYRTDMTKLVFQGDSSRPSQLKDIGRETFKHCKKLVEVDLSNCPLLKELPAELFRGCQSLKTVLFAPHGLLRIQEQVFGGCTALEAISFPSTLQFIHRSAFHEVVHYAPRNACTALKTLSFGSMRTITSQLLRNSPWRESPWRYCSSLCQVNLPEKELAETVPKALWPRFLFRLFLNQNGGILGPDSSQANRASCVYSFLRQNDPTSKIPSQEILGSVIAMLSQANSTIDNQNQTIAALQRKEAEQAQTEERLQSRIRRLEELHGTEQVAAMDE